MECGAKQGGWNLIRNSWFLRNHWRRINWPPSPLHLSATVFVVVCRGHIWNQIIHYDANGFVCSGPCASRPDFAFSSYPDQQYGESDLEARNSLSSHGHPPRKRPRSSSRPPLKHHGVERVHTSHYRSDLIGRTTKRPNTVLNTA